MGWAVLEDGPRYVASGIDGFDITEKEATNEYRLRLIEHWTERTFEMLEEWNPDYLANETFPLVGSGNFSKTVQPKLALSAISAVHTICYLHGTPIRQVAAISIKTRVGGKKDATKVKVRDGLLEMMPELESRRKEWTGTKAVFDEVDAIAVGLVALGYRRNKKN